MEAALRRQAFVGLVVEINPFTQRFCGTRPRDVLGWLADCGYLPCSTGLPAMEEWPDDILLNVTFEPAGVRLD
jgi:hypothetical protein